MEPDMDLVTIEWMDSVSMDGWIDPDEKLPCPDLVRTTGYVVRETSGYFVVTASYVVAEDCRMVLDTLAIPKEAIRSKTTLWAAMRPVE